MATHSGGLQETCLLWGGLCAEHVPISHVGEFLCCERQAFQWGRKAAGHPRVRHPGLEKGTSLELRINYCQLKTRHRTNKGGITSGHDSSSRAIQNFHFTLNIGPLQMPGVAIALKCTSVLWHLAGQGKIIETQQVLWPRNRTQQAHSIRELRLTWWQKKITAETQRVKYQKTKTPFYFPQTAMTFDIIVIFLFKLVAFLH